MSKETKITGYKVKKKKTLKIKSINKPTQLRQNIPIISINVNTLNTSVEKQGLRLNLRAKPNYMPFTGDPSII